MNQQAYNLYYQQLYKLYWQILCLQYLQALTQEQQKCTKPNPSSVIRPLSSEPQADPKIQDPYNTQLKKSRTPIPF